MVTTGMTFPSVAAVTPHAARAGGLPVGFLTVDGRTVRRPLASRRRVPGPACTPPVAGEGSGGGPNVGAGTAGAAHRDARSRCPGTRRDAGTGHRWGQPTPRGPPVRGGRRVLHSPLPAGSPPPRGRAGTPVRAGPGRVAACAAPPPPRPGPGPCHVSCWASCSRASCWRGHRRRPAGPRPLSHPRVSGRPERATPPPPSWSPRDRRRAGAPRWRGRARTTSGGRSPRR